jgi:hypothetical protein
VGKLRAKRLKGIGGRYSGLNISVGVVVEGMQGLLWMRRSRAVGRVRFLRAWTNLRRLLEATPEYQEWRQIVKARAGGACETCGEMGHHCHHIVPVAHDPAKCLDPANGRYLCVKCHRAEHRH